MHTPSFSLYDASAGSGKTYTLVKEYLKIILRSEKNDAYRNILAITFTNKAVHEMKSRIVGNLSEFAKDDPSAKAVALMETISGEIGIPLATIKRKAQQIIRHLIHNYAAFDISTIDKFTHRVIRAFAHDLNLPVTFEVTLDTENLLAEAVDTIIARAGEDETLTKLLVDFTMEKTDDDKSWDISREILETGRLALNENNRHEIVHFNEKTIPEFIAIKNQLIESINELEAGAVAFAKNALEIMQVNNINPASFSGQYFPKHLESIIEGRFNPKNKTYRETEDFRINKTAADREVIESFIPEWISILAQVYKNFGRRDFYRAFLRNITPLSLLSTVSRQLTDIQKEQNVLSIAEFNAIIHREIQNQPAPFIYERLGERYRHFFIDEFQDTSEMQWQNLIPLIDNALSGQDETGQKGTLMVVGDPKQSIYRWRGGKAEQFIELGKGHNPFNNPEKERFSLDTNWRSYSQVIDFNNDFFRYMSGEFDHVDYRALYQEQSFQKSNHKEGGYVNISFLPDASAEDEATEKTELYVNATLDTIKKVLSLGFHYNDIAILTRKRGQGIAVADFLTANDIPLLSSETLVIGNASEVRLIISLLRYLKNGKDVEAKAQWLVFMAKTLQHELPVHDFVAEGMAFETETDLEHWLSGKGIAMVFQEVRRKSLYEAVEIIIDAFLAKKHNAYIQYFLDIVLERDVRGQAGISDFLEYWEKNSEKFSIPSPEGSDAVRIMTIHKSKGLEFPVVIMPFAEEDYSRKPKDKLWLETEEENIGLPKALIDNSSAVEGFGENASVIYLQKKQEELLDNVNVLYVALTRAEEQLYIISNKNINANGEVKANDMSSFFVNYLIGKGIFEEDKNEYAFGNAAKLSAEMPKNNDNQLIETVNEALQMSSIKIAQRESLMWGTKQQKSIEYGNLVHEILSGIRTEEDVDTAIASAISDGLISKDKEAEIRNSIISIIEHPEINLYFSAGNKILNEQAIIRKEGTLIKPDRMVITPKNEVMLLDYKTGAHQPKYKLQLETYEQAIGKMGYRVIKKILVYIGDGVEVVTL
ncbi:UvrD-helicase domain-containing protein [Flavobacterium pallidum]|uniref:DNA 3'-5' helicase n=1 Tax=Flavobacterium pallidum TaxID=2172098 RepID=A0A2S1SLE9_9FLAO|nr:UvrD-helicase domain-containing protein [Flavobacterium pallidum]AWI27177.1 ATP-dependent helicase [Flavobacterium pallidum]